MVSSVSSLGSIVKIMAMSLLKCLLFRLVLEMNQLFGNQRWFLQIGKIVVWNNMLSYTFIQKTYVSSVVVTVFPDVFEKD